MLVLRTAGRVLQGGLCQRTTRVRHAWLPRQALLRRRGVHAAAALAATAAASRATTATIAADIITLAVAVAVASSTLAFATSTSAARCAGVNYGGPLQYTNDHSTVTIGTGTGRPANLTMPGGHDEAAAAALNRAASPGLGQQPVCGRTFRWSRIAWRRSATWCSTRMAPAPTGSAITRTRRSGYWDATRACCRWGASYVDDVAYLNALIAEAVRDYGADPEGIVIFGLSNGGFMAHRMACDSTYPRAIISMNGGSWYDASRCNAGTGRPSVLHANCYGDPRCVTTAESLRDGRAVRTRPRPPSPTAGRPSRGVTASRPSRPNRLRPTSVRRRTSRSI